MEYYAIFVLLAVRFSTMGEDTLPSVDCLRRNVAYIYVTQPLSR